MTILPSGWQAVPQLASGLPAHLPQQQRQTVTCGPLALSAEGSSEPRGSPYHQPATVRDARAQTARGDHTGQARPHPGISATYSCPP